MFCREALAQLREAHDRIAASGALVAALSTATPEDTARFLRDHPQAFPLLSDAERRAYRAFGLGRAGVRALIGPEVIARAARTLLRGHLQGRTRGDALQLGGAFVIDRGGAVRFSHAARSVADHARVEDVIAALPGAPASEARP